MGDEAETRVVKTYPLFGFGFRRSLAGHVLAIRATPEGRQGAPLLEHCRKPALCGRSCGAASGSVSGRDQRQPASGVVSGDRGVRRGERAASTACLVSGRAGGARSCQGLWGAGAARCEGAASAAPMGRLLARLSSLWAAATGSVLCTAAADFTRGHQLAAHPADAGVLSADRSRQRVAPASAVVRAERDGGLAPRGLCAGRQKCAVSLPGQAAPSQGGAVFPFAGAGARSACRKWPRAAFRPHHHLSPLAPAP